ncbi:MAG: outer membrane lipoprotein carrier protein LolA, partial [Betaproteobacteria bacterium]
MKIARFLLLGALLGFASLGHTAEPELLSRISAQVEQYPVVRADFVQTKKMAALKRPLITSGRLVYSRQHGVLWQIEQPFRMNYILGEERIVEVGSDGSRRERGVREVPGLAQVG